MSGTPAVLITARSASRWRCGTEFTGSPQAFGAGHWTEEQLEALRADPVLVVTELESPAAGEANDTGAELARAVALNHLTDRQLARIAEMDVAQIDAALFGDGGIATPEDAIAAACTVLTLGRDPKSWTAEGVPTVATVKACVGFDVTAAQRDAAVAGNEATGESQAHEA